MPGLESSVGGPGLQKPSKKTGAIAFFVLLISFCIVAREQRYSESSRALLIVEDALSMFVLWPYCPRKAFSKVMTDSAFSPFTHLVGECCSGAVSDQRNALGRISTVKPLSLFLLKLVLPARFLQLR